MFRRGVGVIAGLSLLTVAVVHCVGDEPTQPASAADASTTIIFLPPEGGGTPTPNPPGADAAGSDASDASDSVDGCVSPPPQRDAGVECTEAGAGFGHCGPGAASKCCAAGVNAGCMPGNGSCDTSDEYFCNRSADCAGMKCCLQKGTPNLDVCPPKFNEVKGSTCKTNCDESSEVELCAASSSCLTQARVCVGITATPSSNLAVPWSLGGCL